MRPKVTLSHLAALLREQQARAAREPSGPVWPVQYTRTVLVVHASTRYRGRDEQHVGAYDAPVGDEAADGADY